MPSLCSANVLIICPDPEAYTSRLASDFPQVRFTTFASLECPPAMGLMGDADAIIAYGRAFDAECLKRAQKLRWFQ